MKIGIPRCLYYYHYYPQWKSFFESLGHEVTVSRATDKAIANQGISTAVSEVCYPVKVAYGHIMELSRQKLDYVFVPRLVSVEPRYFICPKFMGLPDMLRAQLNGCPPIMDLCIDHCQDKGQFKQELTKWADLLKANPRQLAGAWHKSKLSLTDVSSVCLEGYTLDEAIRIWEGERITKAPAGDLTIGILGHCYTLNDDLVSMGIIRRLREMGVNVVSAEMRDLANVEKAARSLPKRMFWTVGRQQVGAALDMDNDHVIDGLIYVSCFSCGPDSIVSEIIQHRIKNKPFMMLTVDEQSGEAGTVTRLEAFCDLLRRNPRHESNLSPYGQHAYSH